MCKPTDSPDDASIETHDSADSHGKPNTAFTAHVLCQENHISLLTENQMWCNDTTSDNKSRLLHVNLRSFLLVFTSSLEKQLTGTNIKPQERIRHWLSNVKSLNICEFYCTLLARIHCYFWTENTVASHRTNKWLLFKATCVRHDEPESCSSSRWTWQRLNRCYDILPR